MNRPELQENGLPTKNVGHSPPVLTPRTRRFRHEEAVVELTAEMQQQMLLAPPRPSAAPPAPPPASPLPSVKEDPSDFGEVVKRLPPPPV